MSSSSKKMAGARGEKGMADRFLEGATLAGAAMREFAFAQTACIIGPPKRI
jgi:hypothetical protein